MFARPKINQLLANFKKKPVQTKQIPFKIDYYSDTSELLVEQSDHH